MMFNAVKLTVFQQTVFFSLLFTASGALIGSYFSSKSLKPCLRVSECIKAEVVNPEREIGRQNHFRMIVENIGGDVAPSCEAQVVMVGRNTETLETVAMDFRCGWAEYMSTLVSHVSDDYPSSVDIGSGNTKVLEIFWYDSSRDLFWPAARWAHWNKQPLVKVDSDKNIAEDLVCKEGGTLLRNLVRGERKTVSVMGDDIGYTQSLGLSRAEIDDIDWKKSYLRVDTKAKGSVRQEFEVSVSDGEVCINLVRRSPIERIRKSVGRILGPM